jgi:hypothetical protein
MLPITLMWIPPLTILTIQLLFWHTENHRFSMGHGIQWTDPDHHGGALQGSFEGSFEGHCCLWIWKWFLKSLINPGFTFFFAKTSDLLSTCFARSLIWDCSYLYYPLITLIHEDFTTLYIICILYVLLWKSSKSNLTSIEILTWDHYPKLFQPRSINFSYYMNCLGGPTLIKIQHYI